MRRLDIDETDHYDELDHMQSDPLPVMTVLVGLGLIVAGSIATMWIILKLLLIN